MGKKLINAAARHYRAQCTVLYCMVKATLTTCLKPALSGCDKGDGDADDLVSFQK